MNALTCAKMIVMLVKDIEPLLLIVSLKTEQYLRHILILNRHGSNKTQLCFVSLLSFCFSKPRSHGVHPKGGRTLPFYISKHENLPHTHLPLQIELLHLLLAVADPDEGARLGLLLGATLPLHALQLLLPAGAQQIHARRGAEKPDGDKHAQVTRTVSTACILSRQADSPPTQTFSRCRMTFVQLSHAG